MPLRTLLPTLCLLLLCTSAAAQTVPNAGSVLQQMPVPATPRPQMPTVQLPPDPALAAPTKDERTLPLHTLRITGAQAFGETELLTISGFGGGGDFSLTQLRAMAGRITQHYHRAGYFASSAYLPEQDIVDGAVRIEVIEGRYGAIKLHNQSAVDDALAAALLDGIQPGALLEYAPLESRLLLLSDLPGVGVRATLAPAAAGAGRSDLDVVLNAQPALNASLEADTEGNRYTGQNRFGATLNWLEPTGRGDLATLHLLSSGEGLDYARAAYQRQFGKLRASLAASSLGYTLGQSFASLHAGGTAEVWSVQASYPLLRSRSRNLTVGLGYDAKTFVDRVEANATRNTKRTDAWGVQLNGEQFDALGGGGRNAYAIAWTSGQLHLDSPEQSDADALSLHSQGHFDKLGFAVQRLQRISPRVSALLAFSGQVASKNLDSSEQMDLGGANGVRAYPQGLVAADQAFVLTLELRLALPCAADTACAPWQLTGFVDSGSATRNKQAWAQGPNTQELRGAGLGLQWSGSRGFFCKAYYAQPLGDTVADAQGRLGLQLVQAF